MIINVTYDASVAGCPNEAAFKACVQGVVNFYESHFSNNVTINWDVGWGEVDGNVIPAGTGAWSMSYFTKQFTFDQVRSAMQAAATTADDQTALASLGLTDPTGGGGISMTTAEAKVLGLYSGAGTDGFTGLDSSVNWIYNTTNTSGANVPGGAADAFSFLAHEFSEVMGRQLHFGVGSGDHYGSDGYYPLDLFDYSAPGARTYDPSVKRYFSIDGGVTPLNYFNTTYNSGDYFDWASAKTPDSFDSMGFGGYVSGTDLRLLDILGYTPVPLPSFTASAVSASGQSFAFQVSDPSALAAGASTTGIFLSQSGAVATDGILLATIATPALAAGASVSQSITFTLQAAGLTAGTYYLVAVANNDGAVTEAYAGADVSNLLPILVVDDTNLSSLAGQAGVDAFDVGAIHLAGPLDLEGSLTVSGALVGAGSITGAGSIINQASGVIEAKGALSLNIAGLENDGLIQVDAGGALTIAGDVAGAGLAVIAGGTLALGGAFGGQLDFTGQAGTLDLAHSQAFTGAISGFSLGGGMALDLADIAFGAATSVSFADDGSHLGGTLSVSDGAHTAHIHMIGIYVGQPFHASSDGHGGTTIGGALLLGQWAAPVSADFNTAADWMGGPGATGSHEAILVTPGAAFTVTASCNESVHSIQTGANATLAITSGIFTASAGTGTGANAGDITVGAGAGFAAAGTIANSGSISLVGNGVNTDLRLTGAGAFLTGGGTVTLTGGRGRIYGPSSSTILHNVDNTISGVGYIGLDSLTIDNGASGAIEAAGAGTLDIGTGSQTLTNNGLLEATAGSTLALVSTTIDQSAGGMILAASGGRVDLQGDHVIGGTIKAAGTGVLAVNAGGGALDGSGPTAVTVAGAVHVLCGADLTLIGKISGAGQVELFSTHNLAAKLVIGAGGATLSGGGQLDLNNSALNLVTGATAGAVLTNAGDRFAGGGLLGGGAMVLVNQAGGIIAGTTAAALTIDTGASIIANAGMIAAETSGAVMVKSGVANSGLLFAAGGTLTLEGDVTGAGSARINGGMLSALGAFGQNVAFAGTTGVLQLAHAQAFGGAVTGFSLAGTEAFDLMDIGFAAGSTTASFADNGHDNGGVLTVTDGTHTARVALVGDYAGAAFRVTSDGHGGTEVGGPNAQRFIAAMAHFGPASAAPPAAAPAGTPPWDPHPSLMTPRAVVMA